MKQLKVFNSPEFGSIRTIIINDDLWFVGRDVANVLGYSNSRQAIADHVDKKDKVDGVSIRDPMGRRQRPVLINESGVYSLIFGSRLPNAREFKHWVTSEILPSVSRHGGYMVGQDKWTREELIAQSLIYANSIIEERDARIVELEADNQAKTAQLAVAEPKAEYYDAFVNARTSTNFRVTAKEIGVRQNELINLLIDKKFLYRDKQKTLLPYAEKNRGYFIVRDVAGNHWMKKQTYITEKGKHHFRKLCMKAGLIDGANDSIIAVPS